MDDYISSASEDVQEKLREIRAAIKEAAPTAGESISYDRMAPYDHKGSLARFGLHQGFIALYLRPPIIEEQAEDQVDYVTTKSFIHPPLDEEIPVQLIKTLVKERMKRNEEEMDESLIAT